MRTLAWTKIVVVLMIIVVLGGYTREAFAREASIATHATIVILPRPEETVSAKENEEESGLRLEDHGMITKVEKLEAPSGQETRYTTVGVL